MQPHLPQSPGDPLNPSSFINIDSNEQQLAAYLGYNNVSKLRILALSWPVLEAIIDFDPISKNMNKKTAFRLLYDNESLYQNVRFRQKWPINFISPEDDSNKHLPHRWLACILLNLERNLQKMKIMSREMNTKQQKESVELYNACQNNQIISSIDFQDPTSDPAAAAGVLQNPELGAYAGESRLERLNRCWNLLKYFRACRSNHKWWDQRFSKEGLSQVLTVDISHVPSWMLPPKEQDEALPDIPKTTAVRAADNLPPMVIRIVWDKEEEFEGKEDLDAALKKAKKTGVQIPDTDQKLAQDPRLCPSIEFFKDTIRRQFNCQKISMNIYSLELHYKNDKISKSTQEMDLLRKPWADSKRTFEDGSIKEPVLHIQFEATDEPEHIFESSEVPPAVAEIFDTSRGDVEVNSDGLKDLRAAAFGEDDQPLPLSNDVDTGGLPRVLDCLFGQGGSSNDIGSAPKPKKFHGKNARQQLLDWYDGYDVTDEEEKREWQRIVLNEVTSNGKAAKVKKDKLPDEFDSDVNEAIEEGQAIGRQLAMARGEDEEIEVSNAA